MAIPVLRLLATTFMSLFITLAYSQSNSWVSHIAGEAIKSSHSVKIGTTGDVFCAGRFGATADFDHSSNEFLLTSSGPTDAFLTKLSSDGQFAWAIHWGSSDGTDAWSIGLDPEENIYVGGNFFGTCDFDPSVSSFELTSNGNRDIYIAKIDSAGDFIWAVAIGGVGTDWCNSVVSDQLGNVYSTGYFSGSVDFDPGPNQFIMSTTGDEDGYILKLDSSGNFLWAKQFSDANDNLAITGSALDNNSNLFVTGYFSGATDFDPSTNSYIIEETGLTPFVLKLNSDGSFNWVKHFGGRGTGIGQVVDVDLDGNVYTCGAVYSDSIDFDPGSDSLFLIPDNDDAYVSKLDSNGNYQWVVLLGGGGFLRTLGLAVDDDQNVFCTGYFTGSTDFDPTNGVHLLSPTLFNEDEAYVAKFTSGGYLDWVQQYEGEDEKRGLWIDVSEEGSVCLTGYYTGTVDFNPGPSTYNLTSSGGPDVFIVNIEENDISTDVHKPPTVVSDKIKVIPNPNQGVFELNTSGIHFDRIKIFNSFGQTVFQSETSMRQIDLTGKGSGLFHIELETNGQKALQRIVIY